LLICIRITCKLEENSWALTRAKNFTLRLQYTQQSFGNALRLLLIAAGMFAPLRLSADSLAINPTGPFQSYNGSGEIDGFAFTATSDLTATSLGIFAGPSLTLPAGNFNVGLWTDSGTLLASAIVTSADPSQDSFYFHPITPILLSTGQSYVVGAQMGGSVQTWFGGAYTMADGLDYVGSRWIASSSLVMPNSYDGVSSDPGYIGGNLLVGSATPEPSSTGLMVLGLFAVVAGIAGRPRKRHSIAESH
jgi:hypothetical protein